MAVEIERKFLVVDNSWRSQSLKRRSISDHLIARFENENGKARVRICDGAAMLTIKGPRRGFSRNEFHVDLKEEDAQSMVAEFASGPALSKTRHDIEHGGLVWQVDEFGGHLEGLVTCEVELPSENYSFEKPLWAGSEITGDTRYSSSTLADVLSSRDHVA
ncbi:CYTH domain-containing protein [Rhizobiales bacterium RZME27]|jgi:adenylate cyclase|uniref:CYTH domain-containing protein n=1 Tax=Endobacterium cereale TaxID=2663029 RepID=A0A6A8AA59_9HYPH|nr:CYTH domain-containing protein [Endobacterium cereale]MQY46520.1 CYTH domain-containing protein [Endobacterium cereale]